MTIQPAGKPRSILLEQLPADVMARLAPDLNKVDLAAGKVLCKAGVMPGHVYFPCSGLVSMRYLTSNGDAGEIASVGNEGVIGATLLFGSVPNAIRAVVQTLFEAAGWPRPCRRGSHRVMNDRPDDDLPELLAAIIQVARTRFPDHDWPAVENHLRRAWTDVSHDAAVSWQHIRARARRERDALD